MKNKLFKTVDTRYQQFNVVDIKPLFSLSLGKHGIVNAFEARQETSKNFFNTINFFAFDCVVKNDVIKCEGFIHVFDDVQAVINHLLITFKGI